MRKILINLKVVQFQKIAFLRVFFLLVLRLKLILQQDLWHLSIFSALIDVNIHKEKFVMQICRLNLLSAYKNES